MLCRAMYGYVGLWRDYRVICKMQLVVYYQCCVLIGCASEKRQLSKSRQWRIYGYVCLCIAIFKQQKTFSVCIVPYKHERGWENSRQLFKPETKSRILPTPRVFISGNANTGNKLSIAFIKITFPRKNATLFVRHWLKNKFLPVAKSCPRSVARVISFRFAKRCFLKYGFFSLKMSA